MWLRNEVIRYDTSRRTGQSRGKCRRTSTCGKYRDKNDEWDIGKQRDSRHDPAAKSPTASV